MTNAQAALMAAATWCAHDDMPLDTVIGYAARMESHLDERDAQRNAAQEVTSASQEDEALRPACEVCEEPLMLVDGEWLHDSSSPTRLNPKPHVHHP